VAGFTFVDLFAGIGGMRQGLSAVASANENVERFRAPGRGVILFYPVTHRDPIDPTDTPTMGFSLLFPYNEIPNTIVFGVADPSQPEALVVDVQA
jgi:hypothetical protein